MKRLFKKRSKPYYLRSQKHLLQYSYINTPESKTDACGLPFDECERAPELCKRNSSVDTPDSRGRKEDSRPLNCTDLETVDISIDEGARRISLPLKFAITSQFIKLLKKEKKKKN